MERHSKIICIILTICGLFLVACTYNLNSKDLVNIKRNFSTLVSFYMIQSQNNSVETIGNAKNYADDMTAQRTADSLDASKNISSSIVSEPESSTPRYTLDGVTYSPDGVAPFANEETFSHNTPTSPADGGTSPTDGITVHTDEVTSTNNGSTLPTDEVTPAATDTHISAADLWNAITLPPAMNSASYATSKEFTDALYQEAVSFFENTSLTLPWNSVLCIGDSITLGVQAGIEEGFWPISYPEIMSDLYGIYVDNKGVGGATIWKKGPYTLYSKMITCSDNADAVFIMGGLNDWFFGNECPIGDLNTPDTFTYDLNILFEHAKEKYADADIFVIIPMNPAEHAGIEEYDNFDVIRNTERTLAADYGFHIIDLPAQNLLSALDPAVQEAYYSDICHLNTHGYEILGTIISYDAIRIMCELQQ